MKHLESLVREDEQRSEVERLLKLLNLIDLYAKEKINAKELRDLALKLPIVEV